MVDLESPMEYDQMRSTFLHSLDAFHSLFLLVLQCLDLIVNEYELRPIVIQIDGLIDFRGKSTHRSYA